jgi:lipid-A-disaccharide synthase
VGNPLVEAVKPEVDRETFFQRTGLDPHRPLVALLPGSRRSELDRLLPPLVGTVQAWDGPAVQWVLPVAPTLDAARLDLEGTPILSVKGLGYAARAYADAALVCSGTATLETALLGTPFAVIYKLSPLTYLAAKRFVKIPHFGLVNVVAGTQVVPELVQEDVNPQKLVRVLKDLLDAGTSKRIRHDLAGLRSRLGEPGAARRVAEHLSRALRTVSQSK